MSLGLKRGTAELVEHDPTWDTLAVETINQLWHIFGSIAKDIQHFGSTAIKNIKAKPIIDIAIAVDDFRNIEPLISIMEQEGFLGYSIINEEWHLFTAYTDSTRSADTYHIHIFKNESEQWNYCLYFCNYMNDNPNAAQEYEWLKLDLANRFGNDREAYRINKNIYIEQIIKSQNNMEGNV
jgi:GrpB-like predicted nucleotidyltransferase (UPF0157 family)